MANPEVCRDCYKLKRITCVRLSFGRQVVIGEAKKVTTWANNSIEKCPQKLKKESSKPS